MADKTIKVKVETEVDIQPTIAELKQLKLKLKETADPAEFKKLQQQINDTEDAIKAARTGADNFAEILGTLPGPIGQIGNAVGGTVQNLKQFGALKFGDIKASFVDLGKDVVDAGKGIANLTGLTKVYTVTNNALSKSFFGVAAGETAAATAAGVLTAALAATGITLIIGAVALLVEAYQNWAGAAEKAAEAQKTLNERAQKGVEAATNAAIAFNKSQEELDIRRAKVAGQTEDQIQKIRERAAADRIRIAKEGLAKLQQVQNSDTTAAADAVAAAQDELTKLQLDGQIARNTKIDAANKVQQQKNKQDLDKEVADKKKALEDIAKNDKAAAISLLDERDQQRRKIVNDYNVQIKLAADNKQDTIILEEAKLNALRILNDKFAKDDADKKKEALEREKDFWNKAKDAATESREKTYQNELKALDREVTFIGIRNETLLQGTKAYFEGRLNLINAQEKRELADKELTEAEKLAIEKKYQKLRDDLRKDEQTSNAMAVAATLNSLAQVGNALASSLDEEAKTSKAAFEKRKKIQKATAVMSAASGIIQILAQPSTLPSPADWIVKGLNAVALGITTGIQIKNIDKVQFEGGGSSSSSPSSPMPNYNASSAMSIPQIQTTGGMNPNIQLAQTLNNAQKPIKAYVVSGDISSQQALDRRTSRAATFSAG
jgi:hypothetical protein